LIVGCDSGIAPDDLADLAGAASETLGGVLRGCGKKRGARLPLRPVQRRALNVGENAGLFVEFTASSRAQCGPKRCFADTGYPAAPDPGSAARHCMPRRIRDGADQ